MGRTFRINNVITIVGNTESSRNGFRHRAVLYLNGQSVDQATVHYLNRTWESYEYQSVMQKLIDKTTALSAQDKAMAKSFINKDNTDWSAFKRTSVVAGLGDIFGKTQADKNAWKTRMLNAGLANKGLSFPDDWNTLKPSVQKQRLDKVLGFMGTLGNKKKSKR